MLTFSSAKEFYKHMLDHSRKSPFVLMHGDMSLHSSNILWDDELNLVTVIDWE